MIPEQFKDELLRRVRIADVIGPHVQLKKAGGRFYGLCPFHDEKTASFMVHSERQFFYCFGCGANGDAIGFLIEYHGLKFAEAVKQLAASVGMSVPKERTPTPRRVIQRRVDAEAMLQCLEHELLICAIVTGDYEQGAPVSEEDRARFLQARSRIVNAVEFVQERRPFDYERRQMVIEKREQAKVAA